MSESAASFDGLTVFGFESRRREELARMIERRGGRARVVPSMQEVTLEDHGPAVDAANRIITGEIDVVVFLTGVGVEHMLKLVERHVDRGRLIDALSDVVTVVRGPKPTTVLKRLGITPTYRAPEPNTWRELLGVIDENLTIANHSVGLFEYGVTNPSLIAGLEARGARVQRVPVYSWQLPDDTAPLEGAIAAIARGEADVAMFTSSPQIHHLFRLAERLGAAEALRGGLRSTVIASVGPTTSETLRDYGLPVDVEPMHPKMGPLVDMAAQRAVKLVARKRRIAPLTSGEGTQAACEDAPWVNSPFMRACRLEPVPYTPIWLMRQAGRYMPEYRAIREKTSFLELCRNPGLCAEVMAMTVEKLGVDAAIIFSDLLPILEPMGLDLEFAHGEGPVIHNPVRESHDVERVIELESVEAVDFVVETVRQTRASIDGAIPVLGFAGAPFTLASYMIEGGASRSFLHTKTLMYRDPGAWASLMGRLSRTVARYLNAQIAAGAQAVQIFDSWVGCLGPEDYRRFVLPHTRDLIDQLTVGAPVIHFAQGNPALLPLLAEAGGEVIGIDWRIDLDAGWNAVGHDRAVQGNLEPTVLLADRTQICRRAQIVLDQAADRPGHIFNLGHGVLQQTPVENVVDLVEYVHQHSKR
ncbi:MAG: uroporphyrinogen decarboxylase [Planctomycetales bacterium]|nr:uroporphyrinogen decarboxylase [Planctomycetales bacterium]